MVDLAILPRLLERPPVPTIPTPPTSPSQENTPTLPDPSVPVSTLPSDPSYAEVVWNGAVSGLNAGAAEIVYKMSLPVAWAVGYGEFDALADWRDNAWGNSGLAGTWTQWTTQLAANTSAAAGYTAIVIVSVQWWAQGIQNDIAWFRLSLKDKVCYEIGQKTLPDKVLKLMGTRFLQKDPVVRGMHISNKQGISGALLPQGSGIYLGLGTTFHTGPTPLFRWMVTPAAIAVYSAWRFDFFE